MRGGFLGQTWRRVAHWSAAALWLLCYDDSNAERTFEVMGELLVRLARFAEPL